jgi:hypothetical protein
MFEVAKENSLMCMESEFGFAFARRTNPEVASKGVKVTEVLLVTGGSFQSGNVMIGGTTDSIVFAGVVLEGIRPETGIKVTASKFGT